MPENDIYRAYNFVLELGQGVSGYFTEVSGLSVHVESIDYREGGGGPAVRQLAGRVTYGPVTLKYGLTESTTLWDWLMTAVNGKVERKNISIILNANDGQNEKTRWNLTNAWVQDCIVPCFNSLGQEVAIETVILVHEGIERK